MKRNQFAARLLLNLSDTYLNMPDMPQCDESYIIANHNVIKERFVLMMQLYDNQEDLDNLRSTKLYQGKPKPADIKMIPSQSKPREKSDNESESW